MNANEDYNAKGFYDDLRRIYAQRIPEDGDSIINSLEQNNYPVTLMQKVQDDKTIVGLVNTEITVDNRAASFYAEPDWYELQEAWNRKAYPHLYAEEVELIKSDPRKSIEELLVVKYKNEDKSTVIKKEQFIPAIETVESEKIKMAKEAYAKTAAYGEKKNTLSSSNSSWQVGIPVSEKQNSVMEKHDKPKKKNIFEKIGDVFD